MLKVFCYTFLGISALAFLVAIYLAFIQRYEPIMWMVGIGFVSAIISGFTAVASLPDKKSE